MFQPVIKWSGSKRSQSSKIIENFPQKIHTYYEPFVGGGSVLRALMESKIEVDKFVCSDINADLISLWNLIKTNPVFLADEYEKRWNILNCDNNIARKREYYYSVRKIYNDEHKPEDFLFIMRTCINGMPRYNDKNEFNMSFHLTRNGIIPNSLRKILLDWSSLLKLNNVVFLARDYEEIRSNDGDLLYLDPPYAKTKGMYFGAIDYDRLWNWMRKQKGKYILSFDGKTNYSDSTFAVPNDIYSQHLYLSSGNSRLRTVLNAQNDVYVHESLYIN